MALLNVTGMWTAASLSGTPGYSAGAKGELHISDSDKEVLRGLAEQVAAIAEAPIQAEKRELWRSHNDLEPTRPLVFCDPENGWNEIITVDQIQCKGSLASPVDGI